MAKKRRKKARRSKAANPRKRAHKRRHARRRVAVNPKRRHARRRRSNPKRRHSRRRSHRNPVHHFAKKRRHGRRRRSNPGGELGKYAFAILAGIAGFAGTFAIGYFLTKDMVKDGQRNRAIVGLAGVAGGLWLAIKKKKTIEGVSLALGSVLGAFGGWITLKVLGMLPQKTGTTSAVYSDNLAGYDQQMGGYLPMGAYGQEMNAVYSDNLAAVYSDNLAGMGNAQGKEMGYAPPAPWQMSTPFDGRGY